MYTRYQKSETMYPWQRPQTARPKPKQQKSTGEQCDPRKEVMNPLTGNCVSATGDLGKLIIAFNQKGFRLPKCKDSAEVFNPVTLKCVPRSSRAGKTITELAAAKGNDIHENAPTMNKNYTENSQASKALRVLATHHHLHGNKNSMESTNMLHRLSQVNRGIRASIRDNKGEKQMWQEMASRIMTHFDRRRTFKVHKDDDLIEDSMVIESDDPGTKYRLMLYVSLSKRTLTNKWYLHEIALTLDEVIPDPLPFVAPSRFRSLIKISDRVQMDNHDQMVHRLDTLSNMSSSASHTRNTYLCLAMFVRAIISQIKSHGIKDAEGCLETLKDLEMKYKNHSEEMSSNNAIANRHRGFRTTRPPPRVPPVTAQPQEVGAGAGVEDEAAREERAWRAVLARVLNEAREITSNTTGLYGHKEAVAKMKDLPSLLMAKRT